MCSEPKFNIKPKSVFEKHFEIRNYDTELEDARKILLSMGIKDVKPLIKKRRKRRAKKQ